MSLISSRFGTNFLRWFAKAKPQVNWEAKNLYDRLGVKHDASAGDIKKRYYELVRAYHPDTLHDPKEKQEGEKIMEAVNAAYDVLKDEKKRSEYDQQMSANPFHSFNPGARRSKPRPVFRETVTLSFLESVFGCSRSVNLPTTTECAKCHGNGTHDGKPPHICQYCHGAGIIASGFFPIPCPVCGGAGFVIEHPCRTCHGSGQVPKPTMVKLDVPSGVDDGSVISFSTPAGEVVVMCRVNEDPLFDRRGDDLHVTVPISLKTAVLGGTVRVPTLRGVVDKRVLPGTQPYDIERMAGAGVAGRGDLYIHYRVLIPRSVSKKDRKAFEKFQDKYMNAANDMWNSNLNAFEAKIPKKK